MHLTRNLIGGPDYDLGFKAIETPQIFALPFEAAEMIKIRYLGVGSGEFCLCKLIVST